MQLIYGDCLEKMQGIPDKSIDMVLCDLPYGTTACKWDVIIPFEPLWEQYKRVIKGRGAIALFGSEPFSSYLRMSNIKWFKYDWIWDKVRGVGFQIAKVRPMQSHEIVSIFGNGAINYYPIMWERDKKKVSKCYKQSESSPLKYNDGESREYTHSYPKSIIEISNASQKGKVHPTQKPVLLLEYLIKTYTNEGMVVLDNTMGSGSTGVACVNTNRDFIGIEKDEDYFLIAKQRIKDAMRLKEQNDPN
jgi:DNA modification methylase